ncbi:MAG TPA: hypothetical protein VGE02_02085 [Gemmatimonadales bacterium]
MRTPSPYRSLPAARRVELVTHSMKSGREARALWIQRLTSRGGGYRPATLQSWPPDRLAREIVRLGAETAPDELDLLHLLYVQLEPAIQVTFLDEAGVAHENGVMPDELEPPFADTDAVRRAAALVRERHGEDGERYLRTLARYAAGAWPGIEDVVAEIEERPAQ